MDTLLPYLQAHRLVTLNEEYHLSSTVHSPYEKSLMLMNYLKRKGRGSLQKFLCCLNLAYAHMGHKDIAEKLKQTMQDNGIDCNDFCSGSDYCKNH